MMRAKVLQVFRKTNNIIYGYRIQDEYGRIKDVGPVTLKNAIKDELIQLDGYKLTANNRLMKSKTNMWIYESDLVKVSSNLKSMCEKYNVDLQKAIRCLLENPELTDEQIITQYRPDLSINIFGDIIEPDKTE